MQTPFHKVVLLLAALSLLLLSCGTVDVLLGEDYADTEGYSEYEEYEDYEDYEDEEADAPQESGPVPSAAAAGTADLRFLEFDAYDGEMEITFTLQPGEESFHFYAIGDDPEVEVGIIGITGPGGEILYEYDFDTEEIYGGQFEEFQYNLGGVAVSLPLAPQFALEPGEYTIVVLSDSGGFEKIGVILKSGDLNAPQALDFNIWLATGELEVFSAAEKAEMRAAIEGILGSQGLQVGTITYHLPDTDTVAAVFTLEDDQTYLDESEIYAACRAMAAEVGVARAVNIILVDWITAEDVEPGDVVGYSSGVPGTVFEPDANQTCVISSYQPYADSPYEQGATWIHEAAHFMGLFHTTEEDGLSFDPILDTPECPADDYDADGDGYIDDYECDLEGGANNFIFYSGILDFAPFTMTADQAWVLRRHPLFYPVP